MKFIKDELSGAGKTRYLYALGKSEAKVLLGLLKKAKIYTPKIFDTIKLHGQINNMISVIEKSLTFLIKMPNYDIFLYSNSKLGSEPAHGIHSSLPVQRRCCLR